MSTYIARTRHPVTGEWQDATWIDDYFGRHRYGVKFGGEDRVFDPRKVKILTQDAMLGALDRQASDAPGRAEALRNALAEAIYNVEEEKWARDRRPFHLLPAERRAPWLADAGRCLVVVLPCLTPEWQATVKDYLTAQAREQRGRAALAEESGE